MGVDKMKNDGGPAFPLIQTGVQWNDESEDYVTRQWSNGGMSLRAYIATAALQGILACPDTAMPTPEKWAEAACKYADALIAELNK